MNQDPSPSLALELEHVTKLYGSFRAVDDVSLTIPAGSIYGFLGPNGAGKTTIIRMILEIIQPTEGSIRVFGRSSALEIRDRIGYLPEEKGLYKKMKAWSTIAYFATLKGVSRKEAKERAFELLTRYGLKDFAEKKTEALSKGMGQKVQVLSAIAHDPDLVILDEPFSGLDPVNQTVMEEVIQDMSARGKTILFSTHVMQHAERNCDGILLIARGKKRFDGTIDEAKRLLPRRVIIETPDPVDGLRSLPDVVEIFSIDDQGIRQPGSDGPHYELQVRETSDAQRLLEACFDQKIRLRRFDHSEPTLHDVFVHLVGDEAKEASYR